MEGDSGLTLAHGLIGVACMQFAAGGLLLVVNLVRRRGCTRTEGVVVENKPYPWRNTTYYRAVLEYPGPDGRTCHIDHGVGLPERLATDGTVKRTVWYDPNNPKRNHVDGKLKGPIPLPVFYALPFVLLGVGLAMQYGLLPTP